MNIHVTRDGQDFGPYEVEDINGYLKLGTLLPTDMAWHEGLPGWIPLFQIRGVQVPVETQVHAPPSLRQANPALSNGPRLAMAAQTPRTPTVKRNWWIGVIFMLTIGLAVAGYIVFRKTQISLTLSRESAANLAKQAELDRESAAKLARQAKLGRESAAKLARQAEYQAELDKQYPGAARHRKQMEEWNRRNNANEAEVARAMRNLGF